MRYFLIILLALGLSGKTTWAQVGEKVGEVKVLNVKNDTINLPMLGKEALLIFYQDPGHASQNEDLQDYFKAHPMNSSKIESYGVVNMAAAPLIPNGMIKRMARKRTRGTNAQVYFDPNNYLSRGWNLGDVNNASCVIAVDKDRIICFFKAGQVTPAEMQQVIEWVNQNK